MEYLSPLLSLVSMLCQPMTATIGSWKNFNRSVRSLQANLRTLKATTTDFESLIEVAQRNGLTSTRRIEEWIEAAKNTEKQGNSVLASLERRRRFLGCLKSNCSAKYLQVQVVERILEDIKELVQRASDIPVVGDQRIDPVQQLPCKQAIGHAMILEQVMGFLAKDEVGTIGIYGMPGVGKTTLLKNINNAFLTKPNVYNVVMWVVVSRDFHIDRIQQVIAARLGLPWEETQSMEQRASKILAFMRNKRFLLLLDDVWERIDLEKIGVPFPKQENKCKLIFTSRSRQVCGAMEAEQTLRVDVLGQEESWELFREKVGRKNILDLPSIKPLAKEIVMKCKGLPLALITIARAVAYIETEEEWEGALEALRTSPTELEGVKDVFTLLKFSYDNLESDLIRACFLYCAIFPEDYSIEKEQLIEYWIGEGFYGRSNGINAYKGHAIIGKLKAACLLETGEETTQVKMHDVVRSFALWILSEYETKKGLILAQASMGLTETPDNEDWREALVISLIDKGIRMLPDKPTCPSLKTLLLQRNSNLRRIPDRFFLYMPALRVLDLSSTKLEEIPTSIKYLVELRHLDLSRTNISAIPEELGNLTKLKHLDLQLTTRLLTIPREAIRGLTRLEVLNLYYSYGGWELQNGENEDEVRLADLECSKHLTTLGMTVVSLDMLERLHGFSNLHRLIQYLYIEGCNGLLYLEFPASSNHGKRLRRLSIRECHDLQYLKVCAEAGKNSSLPSLEVLALHGLPNLTTVWRNPITEECLRNLRCVSISHCHKLKNVSWVLQLPKLEVIYLFYCEELEEVINEYSVHLVAEPKPFPSLRTLSMRNLPKLKSILPSPSPFNSLESIAVIGCPNLRKLPLKTSSNSQLPTVYGGKEWWEGLEWPGTALEPDLLLPHFVAI